jgi:hypothetical protein
MVLNSRQVNGVIAGYLRPIRANIAKASKIEVLPAKEDYVRFK